MFVEKKLLEVWHLLMVVMLLVVLISLEDIVEYFTCLSKKWLIGMNMWQYLQVIFYCI